MRRIVLYPIYFLVVTPLGLLLRLIRDPLRRRWDRDTDSYLDTALPKSGGVSP